MNERIRERRINVLCDNICDINVSNKERKAAQSEMIKLIGQRSKAQVAKMERQRGLR